MSGNDQGPTDEAVDLLYGEIRDRSRAMTAALSELDDRIEGVVQFNVLALGLLVTGMSAFVRLSPTGWSPSTVPLVAFAVGFLGLTLSTLMAVTGYLKGHLATGLDEDTLAASLRYEIDERGLREELIHAYRLAIAEDVHLADDTAHRFRIALILLIAGLAAFSTGTLILLVGGVT